MSHRNVARGAVEEWRPEGEEVRQCYNSSSGEDRDEGERRCKVEKIKCSCVEAIIICVADTGMCCGVLYI